MKDILIKNVPDNLHRNFKLHCVAEDVSMTECIKDFMERTICNRPMEEIKNEDKS